MKCDLHPKILCSQAGCRALSQRPCRNGLGGRKEVGAIRVGRAHSRAIGIWGSLGQGVAPPAPACGPRSHSPCRALVLSMGSLETDVTTSQVALGKSSTSWA